MADLRSLVEFIGSIAVIAVPVVLILRLLWAHGAFDAYDILFTLPGEPLLGKGPPEEDPSPRWRPELLRARHSAPETETSSLGQPNALIKTPKRVEMQSRGGHSGRSV